MKKILFSIAGIVAVAALVVTSTGALFSDTETSTGNVFTAGAIDLKVDHTKQTYNGVDCKTCDVTIMSDTTNQVVSTVNGSDGPNLPHAAVQVSNPHPAWTVTNDIPGATWIWATNPVTVPDSGSTDVYYTFQKKFNWMGPVSGATLNLGVGADNGYEVKLNGNVVGTDWTEYNYQSPADTYSSFGSYIVQGENVLEIKVKNKGLVGGTPSGNPAGLLYKLVIDGNCEGNYFMEHCTLFQEKDLVQGDHFWQFNDIKPGDSGTNLISLHPFSNDAYVCLFTHNLVDAENTHLSPEVTAGDSSAGPANNGELSPFLKMFAWDDDGDGVYETGEATLVGPNVSLATGYASLPIVGGTTDYVGIAWCAGTQAVVGTTISCDGSAMSNVSQTDSSTMDVTAYAVQQRNNSEFSCADVVADYRNEE